MNIRIDEFSISGFCSIVGYFKYHIWLINWIFTAPFRRLLLLIYSIQAPNSCALEQWKTTESVIEWIGCRLWKTTRITCASRVRNLLAIFEFSRVCSKLRPVSIVFFSTSLNRNAPCSYKWNYRLLRRNKTASFVIFWRLHRCWWRMLGTKFVGDKIEMFVRNLHCKTKSKKFLC